MHSITLADEFDPLGDSLVVVGGSTVLTIEGSDMLDVESLQSIVKLLRLFSILTGGKLMPEALDSSSELEGHPFTGLLSKSWAGLLGTESRKHSFDEHRLLRLPFWWSSQVSCLVSPGTLLGNFVFIDFSALWI